MKKNFRIFLFSVLLLTGAVNVSYGSISLPTDSTVVDSKEIIDNALREFHSLSKQERKARLKEARKAYKELKASGATAVGNTPLWVQVVLAILVPPLGVYLHEGEINTKFWISLVLTLLFFIPGVIYSLIVVLGGA